MSDRSRPLRKLLLIYGAVYAVAGLISSNTFTQPLIAHGLLFALIGVGSILMIRDTRRRVRLSEGRCVQCGYDLCATPNRCPECGTATTQSQPA